MFWQNGGYQKSRVSRTVKRSILQHETRVLQFLQGQVAIPVVYGCGRLEHFECMSLELLGPSMVDVQNGGAGVMAQTVFQLVGQTVCRIRIQASYITEIRRTSQL